MIVYWILLLITAFVAYCTGSISTQVTAAHFVFHRSLRRLGEGNLWLSNFRRIFGIPGFLKLALVEIVKDALPILLGWALLAIRGHGDVGRAFAGFCLLMGRLWPVFNRFKGGHGCGALPVAAFCLAPSVGLAGGVVILAAIGIGRYLSLAAVAGALAVIVTGILVIEDRLVMVLCILTAVLVIVRHVPAMLRLARGQEERLSFEQDITYKFDEKF